MADAGHGGAPPLCSQKGAVGEVKEFGGRQVCCPSRDPNRRRQQVVERPDIRSRDRRSEPCGELSGTTFIGLGQDGDELVTAVAPDAVTAAYTTANNCRDVRQNLVATQMAVAIVDGLEAVEIDEANGEVESATGAAIDLPGQFVEKRVVRQAAGERVVPRGRKQTVKRRRGLLQSPISAAYEFAAQRARARSLGAVSNPAIKAPPTPVSRLTGAATAQLSGDRPIAISPASWTASSGSRTARSRYGARPTNPPLPGRAIRWAASKPHALIWSDRPSRPTW
jgi:hypothetical protein